MSTQKSQLTYPVIALATKQENSTAATDQARSLWTSFSKRFWGYTEEASKSDTSSFNGIL